MEIETKCLHSGYEPENGKPQTLPIYQSTTFKYHSTDEVAKLFDLTQDGFFYSRLANPTVDAVEKKIADLCGGAGALMTSSGQSANMLAMLNFIGSGDHFISSSAIYGGTLNLFNVTFKKLGIDVQCQNGYIELKGKPRGGEIVLPFPSVGATQNAVLAAVLAKEETTIINCAKEPEIVCMQRFLKSAGANVEGAGSAVIKVYPCGGLCNAEHIEDGDRIAAATYMACFLSSGGEGSVCGADKTHLNAVLAVFEQMGANILCGENKIDISCREGLKPVMLQTQPYPGFPTDCLPIITALAATCDKTSVFSENIFKNRFHHAQELAKFGADVHIFGKTCVIKGTKKLCGAEVDACDLRGGASAVIAALAAEGTTIIKNPCYIDRGYEDICKHLKSLGADIKRVTLSSEE